MSERPTGRVTNLAPYLEELRIGVCSIQKGQSNPFFSKRVGKDGSISWYPYIPFYIDGSKLCDHHHPIGVFTAPSLDDIGVEFFLSDSHIKAVIEDDDYGEPEADRYNAARFMLYNRFRAALQDVVCALVGSCVTYTTLPLWKMSSDFKNYAPLIEKGRKRLAYEMELLSKASQEVAAHNAHIVNAARGFKETNMFAIALETLDAAFKEHVKKSSTSFPDGGQDDFGSFAKYDAETEDGKIAEVKFYMGAKLSAPEVDSMEFALGWEGTVKKESREENEDELSEMIAYDVANMAGAVRVVQDRKHDPKYPRAAERLTEEFIKEQMLQITEDATAFLNGILIDHNHLQVMHGKAVIYRCQ